MHHSSPAGRGLEQRVVVPAVIACRRVTLLILGGGIGFRFTRGCNQLQANNKELNESSEGTGLRWPFWHLRPKTNRRKEKDGFGERSSVN
jgi:hypothetical protein